MKVLPRIAPLPAFTLEDQYGLPINSNDLLGRTVFINFTYTRCGEDCAAQREQLVALREHLRAEGSLGSEVLLLTISFDPERDTRERSRPTRPNWPPTGAPGASPLAIPRS